jgi:hypothetical protein
MQDYCLGFIPYCFCSISEKWSISSCFMWDFNSADTCSIACISARGHSSMILSCGFGTIDVPAQPYIFATSGDCPIGRPADGLDYCRFNWFEIANWFLSVCNNCAESTSRIIGCPVTPWLIGCWGDDLVWAWCQCILVHQTCSLHFGLDLNMELTRH